MMSRVRACVALPCLGLLTQCARASVVPEQLPRDALDRSARPAPGQLREHRAAPVVRRVLSNGLRVWIVYRISDAAFLLGAVVLHDMVGAGGFDRILGGAPWPHGRSALMTPLLSATSISG